jgi:hypothetical protein
MNLPTTQIKNLREPVVLANKKSTPVTGSKNEPLPEKLNVE